MQEVARLVEWPNRHTLEILLARRHTLVAQNGRASVRLWNCKKMLIQLQILWIKELSLVSASNMNFVKLTFYQGPKSSNNVQNSWKGIFWVFVFPLYENVFAVCSFQNLTIWCFDKFWHFGDFYSLMGIILPITSMIFKTPKGNYFLVVVKAFTMPRPPISSKDFKLFKVSKHFLSFQEFFFIFLMISQNNIN